MLSVRILCLDKLHKTELAWLIDGLLYRSDNQFGFVYRCVALNDKCVRLACMCNFQCL